MRSQHFVCTTAWRSNIRPSTSLGMALNIVGGPTGLLPRRTSSEAGASCQAMATGRCLMPDFFALRRRPMRTGSTSCACWSGAPCRRVLEPSLEQCVGCVHLPDHLSEHVRTWRLGWWIDDQLLDRSSTRRSSERSRACSMFSSLTWRRYGYFLRHGCFEVQRATRRALPAGPLLLSFPSACLLCRAVLRRVEVFTVALSASRLLSRRSLTCTCW